MIINRVSLMNFKSYKNSSVDLDKNITIILGPNGAGKSTIFEAISYALFKYYNGNLEDLIRKSNDDTDIIKKMEVNVTFTHNNSVYEIKRGKTKSQNIAQLIKRNNETIVDVIKGDTNVTNEIERILNIDRDSFTNAVYIRQGEITDLIDKKPAEKKKLISKLLNLDNLEKSYKLSIDIINRYKEEVNKIEGRLSEEDDLKNNKEELKKIIDENEKQIKEVGNKKRQLEESFELLTNKKEELETKREKVNRLNTNIDKIKHELQLHEKTLNENKDKLEEITELEKVNKKYESKLKQLDNLKEFDKKHDELNGKKELLNEINKNLENITKLEKILEDNHERYNEYLVNQEKISENEEESKRIENDVKSYESLKNVHEKTTNDKSKNINEMKVIIGDTSKILDGTFKSVAQIETEYEKSLQTNQEKYLEIDKSIHELTLEKQEHNSIIRNNRKSLEELEKTTDKCPICQSDISHEKHVELSEEYAGNINESEKKINQINNKLEEQKLEKETIHEVINKIQSIPLEQLKEKDNRREELKNLFDKEERDLENNKEIIIKHNTLKESLDDLNKRNNELNDAYMNYLSAKKSLENYDKAELSQRIEDTNKNIRDLKVRITEISQKITIRDDIKSNIKYLEDIQQKYNKNIGIISGKNTISKNIEDMNNYLTKEHNEIDNYKREILELEYDEENYQKINNEYIHTNENIREKSIEYVKIETQLKNDKKRYEEINEKLKDLSEISIKKDRKTEMIKFLEEVREFYGKDGIQKELRNRVRPLIENNATNIFKDFEFDYDSIKLDENYDITVTRADEEFAIKLLSGGEKIVIALAIRLAIAKTISKEKSEFMILDEPTVHLDEERIENLIESLRSTKIASQLFIVTHESAMINISSNIVEVKKDNGISSFKGLN